MVAVVAVVAQLLMAPEDLVVEQMPVLLQLQVYLILAAGAAEPGKRQAPVVPEVKV
jgi:hypothetical protein